MAAAPHGQNEKKSRACLTAASHPAPSAVARVTLARGIRRCGNRRQSRSFRAQWRCIREALMLHARDRNALQARDELAVLLSRLQAHRRAAEEGRSSAPRARALDGDCRPGGARRKAAPLPPLPRTGCYCRKGASSRMKRVPGIDHRLPECDQSVLRRRH